MSELLNALNPHIANGRARRPQQQRTETSPSHTQPPHAQEHAVQHPSYQASPQSSPRPPPQQPRGHGSYSSELEFAMVAPGPSIRPPQPPPPSQAITQASPQAPSHAINALHEIMRFLHASKEAADLDRQRRLAWEQELEAKYTQRQADLEKQLTEMKEEMLMMKAFIATVSQSQVAIEQPPDLSLPQPTARVEEVPPSPEDPHSMLRSPLTPVSQAAYFSPPHHTFVEESPSRPMAMPFSPPGTSYLSPQFMPTPGTPASSHTTATLSSRSSPAYLTMQPPAGVSPRLGQRVAQQLTALPSPMPTPVVTPAQPVASSSRRKRHTPPLSRNQDDDSDSSDTESDAEHNSKRRRNGHDLRCFNIQHAMRVHIYRSMGVTPKDLLPDAHIEGAPLSPEDPVRFVWQRTVKQSPHNAAMRKRILTDIRMQRQYLYPDVPEAEFERRRLEAAFDQAFKTMKEKWKAQNDGHVAVYQRHREDMKAQKARRRERKKTKLKRRTERRKNFEVFAHQTFDPTLLNECMSSEESGDEGAAGPDSPPLCIRGVAWRSSRLLYFYAVLDADDGPDELFQVDGMLVNKPRRISPRKERYQGPPKDVFHLPPKGVASWMISRRWINELRHTRPDVSDSLKDCIIDYPSFDWDNFHALGDESEEEFEPHPGYTPAPNMGFSYGHSFVVPL